MCASAQPFYDAMQPYYTWCRAEKVMSTSLAAEQVVEQDKSEHSTSGMSVVRRSNGNSTDILTLLFRLKQAPMANTNGRGMSCAVFFHK